MARLNVVTLPLLLCWAAVATARPHSEAGQRGSYQRSRNAIVTALGRQPGAADSSAAVRVHSILNGLLSAGRGRARHPWASAGDGRASAVARGRGASAMAGGRSGWAVSGRGRGSPWTSAGAGGGGRRPWAVSGGGRRGPWAATGGSRHAVYPMSGGVWPSQSGRHRHHWPSAGRGWARSGHGWPFSRSPDCRRAHRGWGIVFGGGRRGGSRPEVHVPLWPTEDQPTEDPTEEQQPTDEPTGRPEQEPTGWPQQQPTEGPGQGQPTGWPAEQPTGRPEQEPTGRPAPEDYPMEPNEVEGSGVFPTESPEQPPAVTDWPPAVQPTQPEKTDCPEGAVFQNGQCVCPDSRPFLDTILERCVEGRHNIY